MAQIGKLDRWQAMTLYAPDRDEAGTIRATGRTPRLSDREAFLAWWTARCLPRWAAEAKWAEHQAAARDARAKAQTRGGRRRGS